MDSLLLTATDAELEFIASLDYGQDVDRHLAALRRVIFDQAGVPDSSQYWYPYEVVELGSHALQIGHEREFAICTLLVISAAIGGHDKVVDLTEKLAGRAAEYDRLPAELRETVLAAYIRAGA